MKKIIIAVAAGVMLTACGGSPEAKFAKNCGASMESEGATTAQAAATCKCAYAKLEIELTAPQLKLAADVISVTNPNELAEIAGDSEDAELVMERAQGAVKSCAA